MKLHILSDLHNEFSLFEPIAGIDADVIVLAGDIGKGANGISWASEAFKGKPIVAVPGNHEYYGRDMLETQAMMRIMAQETGVHLLDDGEVVIDGVRFLGTTLWTDFLLHCKDAKDVDERERYRLAAMVAGQQDLTDFRVIHYGRLGHFAPIHSIELHKKSLAWLTGKLDEPFDGQSVVVTLHLPSMLSVADRFKDELLAACFASNLDYLFGKMPLWIHGHTHDNFDYVSNGTHVVCNPRGYVTYSSGPENFDFNPRLVIEI
jgi:predicted phosphodiesterase